MKNKRIVEVKREEQGSERGEKMEECRWLVMVWKLKGLSHSSLTHCTHGVPVTLCGGEDQYSRASRS